MPRGKKPVKKPEPSSLLVALRFVAAAQRAIGAIEQTYCRMSSGYVWASNGVLSAAHPILETLESSPHTFRLIAALEQAPGAVNLTQIDAERLSVRSDDFQAIIPCVEAGSLPQVNPDAPQALCDDRLKVAMQAVGTLCADGAQKLVNASIQVRNGSCLASDGTVILEAWHGISLPPLMIAPKAIVTGLGKTSQPITRIGCSDESMTLWYENGAWLKTQLYPTNSELPEFGQFLNVPSQPVPVPKDLFTVAKQLQFFSEDGMIYFVKDGARVKSSILTVFAENNIRDVPPGIALNIKALLSIAEFCKTIHFRCTDKVTVFFGDPTAVVRVRGAIATDEVLPE